MLRITARLCTFQYVMTLWLVTGVLTQHQQLYRNKPWPTYSLQNMPQTQFTCHDKILGGYYADAETQCQMFHICVKVAGIGVQDFRFLCPNGTAFDQEAQICADWGDVDCEQSVLYYGSDNFDLYRIGSGFESKRAPLAEEEEATFHLQRAESGDIRRSKELRVDQKSHPDQPPNYTKHFEATTRNAFHNYVNLNGNNNNNNNNRNNALHHKPQQKQQQQPPPPPQQQQLHQQQQQKQQQQQQQHFDVPKKPQIVSYYTPTTSTTSAPTSGAVDRYNDESRQEFDDIFKGSHSSHFFSNRNGGREDDFNDQPKKTKLNDFTEPSKNSRTRLQPQQQAQPTRSKRPISSSTSSTTITTTTTTTVAPILKIVKKKVPSAPYNTDFPDFIQPHKSLTNPPFIGSTLTTSRPAYNNVNRFNFATNDYPTQQHIQPTTYNPSNGAYRLKITTAAPLGNRDNTDFTKPQKQSNAVSRKSLKLEQTQQKYITPAQNNTSPTINRNDFNDFSKIKLQPPQPFQLPPRKSSNSDTNAHRFNEQNFSQKSKTESQFVEPQFFRARNQPVKQGKVIIQEPTPFFVPPFPQPVPIKHRGSHTSQSSTSLKPLKTTSSPDVSPRGFTSRGNINFKATTQRNNEFYSPAVTTTTIASNNVKKFSTLVPKELQYTPTTFKPTTYKNPFEYNFYQTQQTSKTSSKLQTVYTTSTTPAPTTNNPYYNADEDDGQYHPELYEVDFPRNRLKLQRSSTITPSTNNFVSRTNPPTTKKSIGQNHNFQHAQTHLKTQQQTSLLKQQDHSSTGDLSDEEELFKTAHSLNFGAASINKLRADIIKAEKTSQQYNSQYRPNASPSVDSSPKVAPSTLPYTTPIPSTTYQNSFTTNTPTTVKPFSLSYNTVTTTKRPTFTTTAIPTPIGGNKIVAVNKKPSKLNGKGKKAGGKGKPASKRPPHADEDTSYDYAYYDTDTLSESPQEYPEYEISEFSKTKKN